MNVSNNYMELSLISIFFEGHSSNIELPIPCHHAVLELMRSTQKPSRTHPNARTMDPWYCQVFKPGSCETPRC